MAGFYFALFGIVILAVMTLASRRSPGQFRQAVGTIGTEARR